MNTKLAVLFLASALAGAIAGEALSVSGSVRDPQGRVVPGAVVSLYSRASNAAVRTTTDARGAYRFEGVAAGDYLLRAEAPGFAARLAGNIHIAASLTEDIELELAGVRAGGGDGFRDAAGSGGSLKDGQCDRRGRYPTARCIRAL